MRTGRTSWLSVLAAGTACVAFSSVRAEPARPAPAAPAEVKVPFERFTLPNGLTTLVYTDHSVPTVYVGLRYRTGSRDEPPGKTGFAHLFEHLMFQPTIHRPGEFFAPLAKVGGTDMNGATDSDYTNYHETVPSNAIDLALWMESDRMGYLGDSITQPLLDEQRGVVKNEKLQREAAPGAKVQDYFLPGFYSPGHPYGHTTIGSMEDLERASLDDVKTWFRDHYGASNAVLVLAGDIDAKAAREKVTRYFGGIRAGTPASRPIHWAPDLATTHRTVVYDQVGGATLMRTWSINSEDPREATLMLLLAKMLAGSKQASLYRSLVDEKKVATDVSAQMAESVLADSFTVSVALRPGVTPEAAGAALDAAIADFVANGPNPERLRTVIGASSGAVLGMLENNGTMADFLLDGEVGQGDPTYFLKQLQWVKDVHPAELGGLAATWLRRPYYEMRLLPKPAAKPAVVDADRTRMPEPGPFKGKVVFPPITRMTLANGMTLVVAQRPRAPVVEMDMRFSTGALADGGYAPGAAGRAFAMLTSGSRTLDAAAVAERVSRFGGAMGGNAGDRQSDFTWRALNTKLDESFALAADVLRHPLYPDAAFGPARATVAATTPVDIDDERDANPGDQAGILLAHTVWGKPLSAGAVKPARRDAVLRFHDREIGPNNATLYMIGDVVPEQARELAELHFGDWGRVSPSPLVDTPPPPPRGRIILVDAPGATQSTIAVGGLVPAFDPARSAGESLVDAALSGSFQSRLNLGMRQRGWSYGFTGGISDAPIGPRLYAAMGSVQADKTAPSIAAIRDEMRGFVSARPITAEELETVRSASIHALPLGFDSSGAFLQSMVTSTTYGLPADRAATSVDRLSAVTLDDARRTAAELYRPDAMTWVIVGDLRRIEADVRALGIAPVEVWDLRGNKLR